MLLCQLLLAVALALDGWSSHYRDCNILGLQSAGCEFISVGRRTSGGACKYQRHTSHTVPAQSVCCWTLVASVALAPACLHSSSQGTTHPGQGRHHDVALHAPYEPLSLDIMDCTCKPNWVQRRPEAKLYACMGASAWGLFCTVLPGRQNALQQLPAAGWAAPCVVQGCVLCPQ